MALYSPRIKRATVGSIQVRRSFGCLPFSAKRGFGFDDLIDAHSDLRHLFNISVVRFTFITSAGTACTGFRKPFEYVMACSSQSYTEYRVKNSFIFKGPESPACR